MKLSAICTLGATRTGSALLGQLSQPPLQVIEAALGVVQLGEEPQREQRSARPQIGTSWFALLGCIPRQPSASFRNARSKTRGQLIHS